MARLVAMTCRCAGQARRRRAPQASPQDAIRRDYELALQAGNRDAWEAFLQAYPDGFYAGLARAQLKNVAAEEARATAAEKARQAEEAKARLAAERANKAEQEKAAAAAKAAEEKRLAAEKAKQVEEAKAAAAEQRRKEAEAAAAKALAEKLASDKAAADLAEKQAAANAEQKIAAVAPSSTPPSISPQETTKLVQSELRRVGCLTASADGDWNTSSQRSLTLFNKYAGTRFDAKLASFDVLDAIKARPGRICPLVCDHGFRADGDACVKITCRAGYRVNDDNECEKVQDKKPVATREDTSKRDADRKSSESAPTRQQTSGQMYCNQAGCLPVKSGCRLSSHPLGCNAAGISGGMIEFCN